MQEVVWNFHTEYLEKIFHSFSHAEWALKPRQIWFEYPAL